MGLDTLLAGIGGGARGAFDAFTWQQEYDQKERGQDQKLTVEQLKADIRIMLAEAAESGRNARHDAPSGNALVGAETTRRGQDMTSATAQRGQDLNFDLGTQRDSTTQRGQDLTFRTNETRDVTARRGQDLGAETSRRGQDIGASTSRRGQDLTFLTGQNRDTTARRGQDIGASTAAAGQANQRAIAQMPARTGFGGANFYDQPAPSGGLPVRPASVSGGLPVGAPSAAPASAPGRGADEAEANRLIAAYDGEKDPKKKADLQKQMQAILGRLKGGG